MRLGRQVVDRQPIAGVTDGNAPDEVAPGIELLLGVAGGLRQLADELGRHAVHRAVELGARHHLVHQPPLQRLGGRYLLVQEQNLARAPVAHHQRQKLGRARRRHAAMAGADLANIDVAGGNGQIAAQVEFVAAADHHAIQAGDARLAQVAQPVMTFDKVGHPLVIVARASQEGLLLLQVGAGAEGALARAGEHQQRHGVVIARVAHARR